MLKDYDLHPTLATSDAERAKAWYAEKLGWTPARELPGYARFEVGSSAFALYETPMAGTAKNTVMYWLVADVAAEVQRLKARGLAFEDYDFGEYRTVDGVMTDSDGNSTAWFKDADGNIVSLVGAGEATESNVVGAMLATADLERAKAWYERAGGYQPAWHVADQVVGYRSGGTTFNVYRTQYAGTARNTVAAYRVPDIRAEMADLRARGVVFEDYDFGDVRTVDGLLEESDGTTNAWFKDPDGNILGIQGPDMPDGM